MNRPGWELAVISWLLLLVVASAASAEEKTGRFRFFGDSRLRLEQDWDSLQGDGAKRDDRLRLRVRLRGGVEVGLGDRWSALAQARTGPRLSQQSPHITVHDFDGGSTGPYELNLDRWFLRYAHGGFEAWAGRNQLSFWRQDDFFVFDNVTYAGAGGSFRHDLGGASMTWSLNYVALPVGMRDFSGTGTIGQVSYERDFGDSGITLAGGFFATRADADDPAGEILLTENNTRDYRVLGLQLQYRTRAFGRPLRIGADLTHNTDDYGDEPAGSFGELHQDDVDGYVIELLWGERASAGDWQLGFFYAHLEALSAHSSYIQDDWVRWGNANQVRATNIEGSELRAIYTIRPGMNLFARLFLVDAIDLLNPGDTTRESGNRFRLDWNVSF